MKQVVIEPVLNGFIVSVGCQRLVFGDIRVLCDELIKYQKNPIAMEEKYQKEALNKDCSTVPEYAPEDPEVTQSPL